MKNFKSFSLLVNNDYFGEYGYQPNPEITIPDEENPAFSFIVSSQPSVCRSKRGMKNDSDEVCFLMDDPVKAA